MSVLLELGNQNIPRNEQAETAPRLSMPLHSLPLLELAEVAPPSIPHTDIDLVRYPISNDDSALNWHNLQVRTETPEYREATNRTAVVIGESSLMAALPYIHEDTVVLMDSCKDMIAFMGAYVKALRESQHVDEWLERMGLGDEEQDAVQRLRYQAEEWQEAGMAHPLTDSEAYDAAREQALRKAIVPWQADITDRGDMSRLGGALKDHEATVTLLNLTNVIPYEHTFSNAVAFAMRLSALPVTGNAPIMTTSTLRKPGHRPIVETTGPFFGLEDLRQNGGNSERFDPGPVAVRHFVDGTRREYMNFGMFDDTSGIAAGTGDLARDLGITRPGFLL